MPLLRWPEFLNRSTLRSQGARRRTGCERGRHTRPVPERLEDRTVLSAHVILPNIGGIVGAEKLVANANVRVSDAPGSEMMVDINPTDPLNKEGLRLPPHRNHDQQPSRLRHRQAAV